MTLHLVRTKRVETRGGADVARRWGGFVGSFEQNSQLRAGPAGSS